MPGHRLKKLKIDKIAILTDGIEPANKFPLVLLKSDKSNALQEMYKEIFGEEVDVSKASLTMEEAKDCLEVLKLYHPDVPDDIEDAWKLLSQVLIKHMEGEEIMDIEKENADPTLEDKLDLVIEKLGISKEKDDYPSLSSLLAMQEHLVSGNKEIKKHVPVSPKVLKRIRKDIVDPPDPTDDNPVPSLGSLFELNLAIVRPELFEKEAEATEKEIEKDEDYEEVAHSKQAREEMTEIKKEEEDLWPTIPTPFEMGAIPNED